MKITDLSCHIMSIPNARGYGRGAQLGFCSDRYRRRHHRNRRSDDRVSRAGGQGADRVGTAAAIQNFNILEHCRLLPWFNEVQKDPIAVTQGHIDVDELARRPGLGVELNMDIVASRSGHTPLELECCVTADGSTPML